MTTTSQALRIMGVWVRRADAVLADRALANAARAVEDERARSASTQRDLAALDLAVAPVRLAG
ncbi:hypothetical protein [Angustibacter peucedani]